MNLYHYTSLEALHSILQNEEIWLTDIRFLNDKEELKNGVTSLLKSLENEHVDLFSGHLPSEFIESAKRSLRECLEKMYKVDASFFPIFVFSLSSSSDSLSQWRAYGNFSIGFNEQFLEEFNAVERCIYDAESKKECAENLMRTSITTLASGYNIENAAERSVILPKIKLDLVETASRFKHEGFVDEREVRVIVRNDIKQEYRVKNNLLIPFRKLRITLSMIDSITIGPIEDQELSEISLREFVSNLEAIRGSASPLNGIKILKSNIPFRS